MFHQGACVTSYESSRDAKYLFNTARIVLGQKRRDRVQKIRSLRHFLFFIWGQVLLARRPAAIDQKRVTCDKRGGRRGEKYDRTRHLHGLPNPPESDTG